VAVLTNIRHEIFISISRKYHVGNETF